MAQNLDGKNLSDTKWKYFYLERKRARIFITYVVITTRIRHVCYINTFLLNN